MHDCGMGKEKARLSPGKVDNTIKKEGISFCASLFLFVK